MDGFEDVRLKWQGVEYTVPANRQLMLIQKIEMALAGDTGEQAIAMLFRKNGPPHTRLAAAMGAALRHAGAVTATDEAVYLSIHKDIATMSKAQVAAAMLDLIMALVSIVSPPVFAAATSGDVDPKKA